MNLISCPYCGQAHPSDAQFCPVTGRFLEAQNNVCKHCGAKLPPNAGFCPVCGFGTRLDVADGWSTGPRPTSTLRLQSRYWPALVFASIFIIGLIAIVINRKPIPVPTQQPPNGITNIPVGTSNIPQSDTPSFLLTATPVSFDTETATSAIGIIPVELRTNQNDGAQMVFVPSGSFLMGSDPSKDPYFWGAEAPEHTITLDSYWIYRTEVTQGMYQKCVSNGSCNTPEVINNAVAQQYGDPRFGDFPVVMVSWNDAYAYCQWAGARLPTEAEWEKAARGTDGRLFPWGNDPNADGKANYLTSSPAPVGSLPAGASPYGAYDMAGNVLEWVNDFFDSSYYQYSPLVNPTGPSSGTRRIIRGGAFTQNDVTGLRTVARASEKPSFTSIDVGFRCAMNEP